MTCPEVRSHISAFIDGELDPIVAQEIERHIEECHACLAELNRMQWLAKSLGEKPIPYELPPGLQSRVRKAILREAGVGLHRFTRSPRVLVLALSAFVIVAATWWVTARFYSTSREELLTQEILQSHVRSLMPDHLIDVPSADQHTVKPWFDGKVDFSPTVPDLSAEGFVLVGGRLDYVDDRTVAVIVYNRRLHVINLFTWPNSSKGEKEFSLETDKGYHLISWHREGMTYFAVSDVSSADLKEFIRAYSK